MSDLVGNPEDRFSRVAAHISFVVKYRKEEQYITYLFILSGILYTNKSAAGKLDTPPYNLVQMHRISVSTYAQDKEQNKNLTNQGPKLCTYLTKFTPSSIPNHSFLI